jgi:hypothetical protein
MLHCTTAEAAEVFGKRWLENLRLHGRAVDRVVIHYRDVRGVWCRLQYDRPRWWHTLLRHLAWAGTVWSAGPIR